jgi:O-antigen ligase
LPSFVPVAVAALLGLVAWGVGGYAPWASLALELGALALGGLLALRILFRTSNEDRERYLRIRRSQKRGSAEVEILDPSSSAPAESFRDPFYWMGYPFRRNRAGLLITLTTIWIFLSLVPLPLPALSVLSPRAYQFRIEAQALVGAAPESAPWSTTPFLTFQDLLLWLACILLFVTTHHTVSSTRATRRLSLSLLLIGVLSGLYGLVQWLSELSGGAAQQGLQAATGSFGNRNHFAYFQEMLFLVGLGLFQMRWHDRPMTGDRVSAQEEKAKTSLLGLGVAIVGLSLLFSLSRAGIAFTVMGCALFLYLTRARATALALGTVFVAAALWIGIGPVMSRFGLVPGDLASEEGRVTVWRDSLPALSDYWLTGSGLSSFQYVYPIYRSFGGRRFYSWAHNDYLQLGIELGLPGLLLVAAFAFWIVKGARRSRRELAESASPLATLHAGYCAAAAAAALHSFFDFGLHLPANAALFAIVLAVVTGIATAPVPRRSRERTRKKLRRAPPAARQVDG